MKLITYEYRLTVEIVDLTNLIIMKLLLSISIIAFIALYGNLKAQTNQCNTNPGGELTVYSSCVTTPFNTNTDNDYWNNALTDPSCAGAAADIDDKWAWFTALDNSTTITYNSTDDAVLHLFDAGCNANTMISIDCSDNNSSGDETITYTTTIGNVYHIRIQRYSNDDTMNGTICVHSPSGSAPSASAINNDCDKKIKICGTSVLFSSGSNGPGVSDPSGAIAAGFPELGEISNGAGNADCLGSGEHESSWYTFTVSQSGSLGFVISPQNGTDDFDFAIWGPNPTCVPTSLPIRCSFAHPAGNHDTGLVNDSGDDSEDDLGDGFVNDINVIVDETYILLIDNYSTTTSPFDLAWSGTAELDCANVLPIELGNFDGKNNGDVNTLTWTTLSEINNDYFTLEVSTDGINFENIATIKGAGNSIHNLNYLDEDRDYAHTINYYRLTQTDFDGASEVKGIVSIDNRNNTLEPKTLVRTVNIMGQTVDSYAKGILIEIYTDGTTKKIFKK